MYIVTALLREKWARYKSKRRETQPDTEHLIDMKDREIYSEFPTLDSLRRIDIISCLLVGIQDSVRRRGGKKQAN